MKKNKKIYLDYAATTPLDPRVRKAMEPYGEKEYGNPTSIHSMGRRAREAINEARATVARILNCRQDEIVFTGSGTEAINLAIFGVIRQAQMCKTELRTLSAGRGHLVTTKIEHHAVLHSVEALVKEGYEVVYLPVDKDGLVDPRNVKAALRPDTVLVSVMYANNEIGAIEPIAEIGKVVKEFRRKKLEIRNSTLEIPGKTPFFLVDACQAVGALDIDVQKFGVDLLALNGSKIYGPKGVGALFVRRGVKLKPLIYGGGQESGLRSGTENVSAIVGLAEALKIAHGERAKENARLEKLRDYFIAEILKRIPGAVLNGHPEKRLPNNINISIPRLEGEAAVIYLDEKGIAASTGSACSSIELTPSHVVSALGRSYKYTGGSLRFSLGRKTTKKDLDYVLKVLPDIVKKLQRVHG
ncbi:MAG: hypothetical protein A3C07_02400 [Candidatus Sungbacteria bacterium RIFCSPHIGHO2_02_FULL_47_11]|uniref:Aminotransferase class V domain-containing protein n=1 Tax=Candidatus Sungbacteria bacterium RIFCSPHIGHO2_02_FULL_47_11 TaxID=1802270 RepID=A0A1G2KGV1_9BACT|nr:MAG: hypothetical protein A3C07_02400 [Candidatus Sungbacteria bacterium RIFCSPHIGHO2_02_FULL_47_11]